MLLTLGVGLAAGHGAADDGDFANFESAHVHPIAISDDGRRLYAVNTPEARLGVFEIGSHGRLVFLGDVPVGLEPVSLAVRPGTHEVWVANHLSDTVSIVDGRALRTEATLPVGDEPTDVAFAAGRAFVSLAGNRDHVAVFDAGSRELLTRIEVLGDDPRALAATPDGRRVALVVLESGNGTTNVHEAFISDARPPPDPWPARDVYFPPSVPMMPAPHAPLIVQQDPDSGRWLDEAGQDWSDAVFFGIDATLPDYDLFWIDAQADPPFVEERVSRVGTSLFDVAIHPSTGAAWVPNTDARNLVRFEPNLRGHVVETRVSIVAPEGDEVDPIDLNPHIDRSRTPGPPEEIARSLSIPVDSAFDRSGDRYYVAAFGSSKVGVLDGRTGEVLRRIEVGGGPSGLALHPRRNLLYVLERFSNTIATVNTRRGRVVGRTGVSGPRAFDPSPRAVREGRRLLYDGQLSSGHGDLSCASCHVFGNFDGLAWDLGDPTGYFLAFEEMPWLDGIVQSPHFGFDPMKGPMTTQSLRGLSGTEPLHWRGDRADVQAFNGAFVSLLGRDRVLSPSEIDLFAEFVATIQYPPNPNRRLDDSLPAFLEGFGDPRLGEEIFLNVPVQGTLRCVGCHASPVGHLPLIQTAGGDQSFKIPHLRNVYEKMAYDPLPPTGPEPDLVKGGFGVLHAGALSLRAFLGLSFDGLGERLPDLVAFLLSFPTETAPCVGSQRDLHPADGFAGAAFVAVLAGQAATGRCDAVAHGWLGGEPVAFAYDPAADAWLADRKGRAPRSSEALLAGLQEGDLLTVSGVPAGSGHRLALDRDRDGCFDGDERERGTDPASPGTPVIDSDADGISDETDRCPGWKQRDPRQRDRDRNGQPDECQCGDVNDDGRTSWRDLVALWMYLNGNGRRGLEPAKCNVAGAPGNDPALCDHADLSALFVHLWSGSREPVDLCLPPDPGTDEAVLSCEDEPLPKKRARR